LQAEGRGDIFRHQIQYDAPPWEVSSHYVTNKERSYYEGRTSRSRAGPAADEQVIFRNDVPEGFWKKKIVESQQITTRGIRINGQLVLDFSEA
jgi:hypothetical protein